MSDPLDSMQTTHLTRRIDELREYVDQHDRDIIAGQGDRVETAHTALNERLALKDRWINSEVTALKDQIEGIRKYVDEQKNATDRVVLTKLEHIEEALMKAEQSSKSELIAYQASRKELDAIATRALDEFKSASQQRVSSLSEQLSRAALEAKDYITREAFDAKNESTVKQLESVEKSLRERFEVSLKQISTTNSTEIDGLKERMGKLETNVSTLGARLSQSILMLGTGVAVLQFILKFTGN